MDKIIEMKAVYHHAQNFEVLKDSIGDQAENLEHFSKLFYTYDDTETIKNLSDGIEPRKIDKLSKKNRHHTFFKEEVKISSLELNYSTPTELLTPRMETMTIKNLNP